MYYKVVRRLGNNELWSAVEHDAAQKYLINQYTLPKIDNSYLFVFDDYELANRFRYREGDDGLEIWQCEIGQIHKLKYISFIESIEEFWKLKKRKKKIGTWCMEIPSGTVFTDKVKLLKKVKSR